MPLPYNRQGSQLKKLNTSKDAVKLVLRDKDVRTACVALEMDSDAFEKLRRTQDLFRRACNLLVEIVCEDAERKLRLWQRYNLHHAGYYLVRETVPELGAQLTCNAIRAVSAAYQSILANNPKYTKDKKLALPKIVFKNIGIHLDARTLSFSQDHSSATVFTSQKRVCVQLCPGAFQQEILNGGKWRECELVYKRGKGKSSGRWQLHIAVERKLELPDLTNLKEEEIEGVDVGENNMAATSDGQLFKAGKLKDDRDKFLSHRARLQRKGTRNAKRKLREISGRERRHVEHVNHVVSKQIVKQAADNGKRLIVLEDLTHIRERIKAGHKVRARLHRWPFRELQQMIVDNALRAGIRVMFVDPRYTSQTCSACGAIGKRKKHRFECHCGYRAHSDLNAGRNLRGLGCLLMTQRPAVNRPDATLQM